MKTDYEVRIHAPFDLSKDWYVYTYANNKITKKFYKGLNKITSYEDRILEALSIKKFLESEIKKGWNPNSRLPSPEDFNFSILKAYEFGLNSIYNSGISKSTLSHYKTHHRQLIDAIKSLGFEKENIKNFEPYHISLILEECQRIHSGSNDFFNKHLKSCKRVFRELCEKFIINNNPAFAIRDKEHKPKEKRLLTPKEYDEVIPF